MSLVGAVGVVFSTVPWFNARILFQYGEPIVLCVYAYSCLLKCVVSHFSHSTWSLVVLASIGMLFVISGLSAVSRGAISWAMALGFLLVVLLFLSSTCSTVLSLSL